MSTPAPAYRHDCEKCVFLGSSDGNDLYFCPSALGGSVLARYSSKPHEYASSDAGIWIRAGWPEREPSHPLSVAIEVAQSRGLVARSSLVLFGNSVWRVEGSES